MEKHRSDPHDFAAASGARRTRDFASIDDHARLPWRFLARQLALLGILSR
jgi:hypothetical protein